MAKQVQPQTIDGEVVTPVSALGKQIPIVENQNEEVYGEVMYQGKRYYVLEDRNWVRLLDVNPLLVRMAMRAVKLPKRPTYSVTTMSGRVEVHPLDEESATASAQDQARWDVYTEERDEAIADRTDSSTRALFFYGTQFTPPDTGWDEQQEMLGIEVPVKAELRKVHYLMTVLSLPDLRGLLQAISRSMGIDETEVIKAEESF